MPSKKSLAIIGITAAVIGIVIASLPAHLKMALLHQRSDIDDYLIFENRTVETGTPAAWRTAPDAAAQRLPAKYESLMADMNTVAFLVARGDEIIFERYWRGRDNRSISNSFSMAKSIVSILVGIALDEGSIRSIDQPAGDFIPEFKQGANAALTIRDLLTMSSGLDWNESYGNPFSITAAAYYGNDLDSIITGLRVVEEPGKKFVYQSGNTQLLGAILEKATGMNLSAYASKKLWEPLGSGNEALWSLDHAGGTEKAFCCFNATARDFARIGRLILGGGTLNGRRIISRSYLDAATAPASHLKDEEGRPVDFYGYQFWIMHHRGLTIPMARGILGQYIFIIPAQNGVAVRLGEKRSAIMKDHITEDAYEYADAALELLGRRP
ncbi:MAG: serine hydrolase [Spirochaetes bacterium]|nr:serine hydrolase [Spirochaetota bacterium]